MKKRLKLTNSALWNKNKCSVKLTRYKKSLKIPKR